MLRSWLSSVYVNTSVMLRAWLSSVYVNTSVMLRAWLSSVYVNTSVMLRSWLSSVLCSHVSDVTLLTFFGFMLTRQSCYALDFLWFMLTRQWCYALGGFLRFMLTRQWCYALGFLRFMLTRQWCYALGFLLFMFTGCREAQEKKDADVWADGVLQHFSIGNFQKSWQTLSFKQFQPTARQGFCACIYIYVYFVI